MRTRQRPRRTVHPAVVKLAAPLFRYSQTRNAYVLRGVGDRIGPVLRPKRHGERIAGAEPRRPPM